MERVIRIWTTDSPPPRLSGINFAYCSLSAQRNVVVIPDFLFWAWPEVGVSDYRELIDQVVAESMREPERNEVFWIGNPEVHPTRHTLLELTKNDARFEVRAMQWDPGSQPENHPRRGRMATQDGQFVSLPEHCRFKYLLDLQGAGYSARLKVLLFSRRVIFLQQRRWREFFFDQLIPFYHYIPVNESLDNLFDMVEWANDHPEECDQIARRAQEFALQYLTRSAAIEHLQSSLATLLV